MKAHTVQEVCKIINGELIQGSDDFSINYVANHFYQLKRKKTLFFLRRKRQIDWKVIEDGLPCVIVTDVVLNEFKPLEKLMVIKVEDVELAYWQFVDYYRELFNIPVIAVTGTCGKTTTKEMIKHILGSNRNIQATHSSANSRLAHLQYLFGIDEDTEAAVFETAVGRPGDVSLGCRFFKPTIGIITNIGEYHLDGCKTLEGYIQSKAEMLTGLKNEGILILNADDEKINRISLDSYQGRVVYFGMERTADFHAYNVRHKKSGMEFTVEFQKMKYPGFVTGFGKHQVYNALAAVAAVHELGVGIKEAIEQLKSFENIGRHLEISTGIGGSTLIDDTWSFNTTSLQSGLKVLKQMGKGRTTIVLLSNMVHLGDSELEVHKLAGEIISNEGVDILVTVGDVAEEMGNYAISKGLKGRVYSFKEFDQAYNLLEQILDIDSILLVKGSMYNQSMIRLAGRLKLS